MKNNKKFLSFMFYLASVCFFISCITHFAGGEQSLGVLYLCLASSNLCNGALWMNKLKKEKEEQENE